MYILNFPVIRMQKWKGDEVGVIYELAKIEDLQNVYNVVQHTIRTIYPKYYPAKGVMLPLQENNVSCEAYVLENCGHSPFMEKYAKDEFYSILSEIIS